MDSLDQIVGPAAPLLRRVDETLSHAGAPADHRVWTELRRVRLLPGDAVHAVAGLRAADLSAAVPALRADAQACVSVAESLPRPGGWSGPAADAYDAARHHTADHLSGGPDSLDERLEATADLADALADWMGQTRVDLAGTLARALMSAQAVELTTAPGAHPPAGPEITAAADLAEQILQTVADSYEQAQDLLHSSRNLAEPLTV
jgi:hypothetical protein